MHLDLKRALDRALDSPAASALARVLLPGVTALAPDPQRRGRRLGTQPIRAASGPAPTARTVPARSPRRWPLIALWMVTAPWSPAMAGDTEPQSRVSAPPEPAEPPRIGAWQLLTVPQMWRAARQRSGSGAPRLLPLALMPTQRGAWWLGFSRSRATGDACIELRLTLPLEGRQRLPTSEP